MSIKVILLLIAFVALSSAATTCGNAGWWQDIKTNLIDQWDSTDSFATQFNSLKTAYDALEATSVTDTHEVLQGHCKPFFKVGTDKSCCSLGDHKKMINLAVKASVAAAIPQGRDDACNALMIAFQKSIGECNKAKANSTSNASASLAVSGSLKGSNATQVSQASSPSVDTLQSTQKLLDKVDKAGVKAQANAKKALGQAALAIAQQLRGTLCAICGDPDAQSTIFDPSSKTWFVNQGAMDDYISKIQIALNQTAINGKDCIDFIQYNQKKYEKVIGTCDKVTTVINDYKAKLQPCTTEAECKQIAADCFNPLTTTCVTNIAADSPPPVRRNMRTDVRILAGPSYQASSTGGATSVPDQTEDGSLSIAGVTITTINQQASTAQTQYNATGGGSVDYDAAIEAQVSVSILLTAFASMILFLLF